MFKKFLKSLTIGVVAVFLATIGIDAADNFDNMSDSIFGRIFSNKASGPCPSDMIFVPTDDSGFCIDKYEASPGSDCYVSDVSSQLDTSSNLNKKECAPVSSVDKKPWVFISQTQAQTACAKAGKRLASGKEWYLASLGVPDIKNNWTEEDCHVNKNWPEQPGLTGGGKNCISAYGAFDMVGNVWEWVAEEINDGKLNGEAMPEDGYVVEVDINGNPIKTDKIENDNFNSDYFWIKTTGIRGMARGGYWDNQEKAGVYSMYLVSPTSYAGAGVGFRCVSSVLN